MKSFPPTQAQIDSGTRKLDIVLGVAGERDEQINVLVHALANAAIEQRLEMASVINALTDVYLAGMERLIEQEDEDYDE